MAWLLDTNILSELRRPRPDPNVVAFVSGIPLDQLTSVLLRLQRYGSALRLLLTPFGGLNCLSG